MRRGIAVYNFVHLHEHRALAVDLFKEGNGSPIPKGTVRHGQTTYEL